MWLHDVNILPGIENFAPRIDCSDYFSFRDMTFDWFYVKTIKELTLLLKKNFQTLKLSDRRRVAVNFFKWLQICLFKCDCSNLL